MFVTVDTRPIWWRAIEGNPPVEWQLAFEGLTGDELADQWGLAAAIFIARVRRRTAQGPTFAELFDALFPENSPLYPSWPSHVSRSERAQTTRLFRLHVAIEWKRRGWINFSTNVPRSLRVGRAFREQSRQRQTDRRSCADGLSRGLPEAELS